MRGARQPVDEEADLPEFPTPHAPSPVAGCAECERHARRHVEAEQEGDGSRAADVRVVWRAHKARTHKGAGGDR